MLQGILALWQLRGHADAENEAPGPVPVRVRRGLSGTLETDAGSAPTRVDVVSMWARGRRVQHVKSVKCYEKLLSVKRKSRLSLAKGRKPQRVLPQSGIGGFH